MIFILAAFDTTANSSAFILCHLAKNSHVQKKLADEIGQIKDIENMSAQDFKNLP